MIWCPEPPDMIDLDAATQWQRAQGGRHKALHAFTTQGHLREGG